MKLDVDIETSTVTLAGRRFPAVGLICPCDDPLCDHDAFFDHTLGQAVPHGKWGYMDVYIPAESGVLFHVEVNDTMDGLSVHLNSVTCELERWPAENRRVWLPTSVSVADCHIGLNRTRTGIIVGGWDWEGAEEEWVVELIDRLASYPYDEPEGPRCKIMRLGDLAKLDYEYQSRP